MSKAQDLRTALKTAGYNARRVTVRDRPCTTEWSLLVTIRCASVSLSKIQAIVAPFSNVRRDGFGEILGGGNTYLTVEYSDELVDPIKARFGAQIDAAAVNAETPLALDAGATGFTARKIPERDATFADEIELSGPGFDAARRNIASGVYFAAKQLAIAYLDTRAQEASEIARAAPVEHTPKHNSHADMMTAWCTPSGGLPLDRAAPVVEIKTADDPSLHVVGQRRDGSYQAFTLDCVAPGEEREASEGFCRRYRLEFVACSRARSE